jgi:HSP20 family protein
MANKAWFPSWGDRGRDAEHFRGFKTQIESLFEDWFGRSMGGLLAPRVDVAEDERSVTLTAELAGVAESDVDVQLVGDQLTIKGEKRSEHEQKKDAPGFTLHRMERSYGGFQRTISIPHRVDPDQVTAEFKDGVLKVVLPKPAGATEQGRGRKIPINKPVTPARGTAG